MRCSTRATRRSARSTSTTRIRSRSRPSPAKVAAGFAREDLFCVVHEIFQTDTADYADILLPATTQLEQLDIHRSYGHLYALANNPAIAPLGEAKPNTEVFRLLAARMGFAERLLPRQRRRPRAAGVPAATTRAPRASTGTRCKARRLRSGSRCRQRYAPFAHGDFPTPSGKCEFHSATLARARPRSAARRSCRRANRSRATRRSRAAIRWRSSRRRRATSSTRRSPTCRRSSPRRRRRGSTSIRDDAGRARDRRRRPRAHLQRSRQLHRHRARHRPRAPGRRRRAVDLVEEARAGRRERQRRHEPGADRPRPRRDVLRLPGRGRATS